MIFPKGILNMFNNNFTNINFNNNYANVGSNYTDVEIVYQDERDIHLFLPYEYRLDVGLLWIPMQHIRLLIILNLL